MQIKLVKCDYCNKKKAIHIHVADKGESKNICKRCYHNYIKNTGMWQMKDLD